MSALSYLEESVVPMRTVLPSDLLGSMRTSLEPSADSNDPVDFFTSGASSATSLGMPGISEGSHAKMSLLSRRKSMSALSYSEESMVPMCTILPSELLGSMRTSLEPSADSNDSVDFFASGVSSVTSLRAASSPEATIAAA